MTRETPHLRSQYRWFLPLVTRWLDNDAYGHINNALYYSFFDTAVNTYLIQHGVLDPTAGANIGLVVESRCVYFSPLTFPEPIEAGLRVAHLGNSSVRYEVAIFAAGALESSAQGHFIHVYVDRDSRRPAVIPPPLRSALAPLRVDSADPHQSPARSDSTSVPGRDS